MTTIEMLKYMRFLMEADKDNALYYITAVQSDTTASGNSFKVTTLNELPDDLIKGMNVYCSEGANAGYTRKIKSWTKSAFRINLTTSFPYNVDNGDVMHFFAGGDYSDGGLINCLNEAQDILTRNIKPEEIKDLITFAENTSVSSTIDSFAMCDLPDNIVFLDNVHINGLFAEEVETDDQLVSDSYLDRGYILEGKQLNSTGKNKIKMVPNENLTVRFKYIKMPARLDVGNDCELPEHFHTEICRKALQIAQLRTSQVQEASANSSVAKGR